MAVPEQGACGPVMLNASPPNNVQWFRSSQAVWRSQGPVPDQYKLVTFG